MSTFPLEVVYAHVAVFDARSRHPFNDWSDTHVAQGFAWRPGSVSFATLEPAGKLVSAESTNRRYNERDVSFSTGRISDEPKNLARGFRAYSWAGMGVHFRAKRVVFQNGGDHFSSHWETSSDIVATVDLVR